MEAGNHPVSTVFIRTGEWWDTPVRQPIDFDLLGPRLADDPLSPAILLRKDHLACEHCHGRLIGPGSDL